MAEMLIRLATEADLGEINEIYNHYVIHSNSTYTETPDSMEDRCAWLARHGNDFPVTVAVMDGTIVGWGSLSPFHGRSAYRRTVENSIYIQHEMRRKGIGAVLMKDLLNRASAAGHHTIIALIDSEQPASIALHARFGFQEVGRLREVGFKFGKWLDVIYMQLMLKSE